MLDWPLRNALHDGLLLGKYPDDDTAGTFIDYMGNAHTYDAHAGTDICLFDFRAMDRGMEILAAQDGVVNNLEYGKTDRNTGAPYPDNGNGVTLLQADGRYAIYWHIRKNSALVNMGESVKKGQVLALVGSSGGSAGPHLHFEMDELVGGQAKVRDPWHGSHNTQPSLWANQEPYVGTVPMRIYDLGITTEAAAGGKLGSLPMSSYQNRFTQPAMFGAAEPTLQAWVLFQGAVGGSCTLAVIRPDGSQFSTMTYTVPSNPDSYVQGYVSRYWVFAGKVTSADYGTWTLKVSTGGNVMKQVSFEVGAATQYPPRFSPISGRSFRINGSIQRDTLRLSALGGPATYSLHDAPDFVSLGSDSVVTIAAVSSQPNRSLYFQVLATNASGLMDTMWYQLVDPSKPMSEQPVATSPTSITTRMSLQIHCGGNASDPAAVMHYGLPKASRLDLSIYDVLGQRVWMHTDAMQGAGNHLLTWDGRNTEGQSRPGVYLVRLQAAGQALTRTIVLH